MSNLTWEEKIEQQLDRIEKKLDGCTSAGSTSKTSESGLVPGKFLKKIYGSLVDSPETKEVDTQNGPSTVCNFTLNTEEYGEVRVGVWGEMGIEAKRKLAPGHFVGFTKLSIRDEFDGTPQVSTTRKSEMNLE